MKKLLFLLALGAPLPVWAQNPAPQTQVAPFNWRIRLSKGQKFRTTMNETSKKSEQKGAEPGKAAEAPVQIFTTEHLVFDQEVLSSDENGARIELVYREAKQTTDEAPDADDPPTPDAIDFKAGARFHYKVSPEGKISDVEGVTEFVNRLVGAYDQQIERAPDTVSSQLMRAVREGYQASYLYDTQEEMLGKSSGTLPSLPLALGQSWNYDDELPAFMGVQLKQAVTATFGGREGGLALSNQTFILSGDGEIPIDIPVPADPDDPDGPTKITLKLKFGVSGTGRGEMKIDEKTGIVRLDHSVLQYQLVVSYGSADDEDNKSEDVTDTVEESTSTTEMLPPETVVALPDVLPAAPAV